MDLVDILRLNLLSPMVLAFVLGIVAVRVKSDLRIPEQVYSIIAIYLLFAIGLRGGFDLARSPSGDFLAAAVVATIIGAVIPLWSYLILRRFGRLDASNAIALGIHMGAVSAVTLSAAVTFLQEAGEPFEGFMPTIYVIMELPAIVISLALAQRLVGKTRSGPLSAFRTALSGKSFLLLGGGVIIGLISGPEGYEQVSPFFDDLFPGFLTLFLLEMGTQVGKRLDNLRDMGWFLLAFGIVMPLLHGLFGVALGVLAGLSVGGSMIMGTLAASASFITAPAVAEQNLPDSNPVYYLTVALVIVLPFNITLGLPIYFEIAQLLIG